VVVQDINGNQLYKDEWLIEGSTFDIGTAVSVYNPNLTIGITGITGPATSVIGQVIFTGPGVSQSGNTFTFSGGGSGMTYPPGNGIPKVVGGTAWGPTYGVSGSGLNVIVPGGTPAAGSYIDGFSFAWTALPFQQLTTTGSNCATATLTGGTLNIPPCTGGGGGTLTGSGSANTYAMWSGTTALTNGHLTESGGFVLSTFPIKVTDGTGNAGGFVATVGNNPGGIFGAAVYETDNSVGYAMVDENNTGPSRICTADNSSSVSGCGLGSGSSVQVNGVTTSIANFGSSPSAPTNGINVVFQLSGTAASAYLPGDGDPTHFLNGTGAFSAPSTTGTYFAETVTCTTTCTLAHTPITFLNLDRNGIGQRTTTDFSVSGSTVTLVAAATGGDTFYAQYYY